MEADHCELCGKQMTNARERVRHLRTEHPAYARGVMARLLAPFVFLASILVLAAVHAPPITFLIALAASYAFLFFGKVGSRSQRRRAGVRGTLPVGQLMRQGGWRFVLLIPLAVAIVWMLSRVGR